MDRVSIAALVAAALCAGLMGLAIQRGGTCLVAAVEELLRQRRPNRLLALVEAAVWVSGGLLVLHRFMQLPMPPAGFALTAGSVAGAALLGLGAFLNGACVFGAIARFGSGQWAQAWMPVGFLAGCAAVAWAPGWQAPPALADPALVFRLPPAADTGLVILFAAFVLLRIAGLLRESRARPTGRSGGLILGDPHRATTVIAVMFLCTLVLAGGTWAYTDLLQDVAAGRMSRWAARGALVAALLAGAVIGGRGRGSRSTAPTVAASLRSLAGGALMGAGTVLTPGGNDSLILVGMPLLLPYAWVAFFTMCLAIAVPARLLARTPAPARAQQGLN